jgi:hypothetical protein
LADDLGVQVDHVGAVIRASRTTHARQTATGHWKTSSEVAYFVCEFLLPAALCAHVCDGSFREDASRIRCNPGVFARLRSFASNILHFNGVENVCDTRYRITLGVASTLCAIKRAAKSADQATVGPMEAK